MVRSCLVNILDLSKHTERLRLEKSIEVRKRILQLLKDKIRDVAIECGKYDIVDVSRTLDLSKTITIENAISRLETLENIIISRLSRKICP